MVQRRERPGFLLEAGGELRIARTFRREQLECDEAVQRLLSRLIDHPHATASKTFKDFQLRKVRRNLFRWQRRLSGRRIIGENSFRLQVQCHQAFGTNAFGGIRW